MHAAIEHAPLSGTVRREVGHKDRPGPNLFWYAASGSAQNAFLCWLIAHAELDTKSGLAQAARELIGHCWARARLDDAVEDFPDPNVPAPALPPLDQIQLLKRPVQQYQGTDLLFVASVCGEPWVFLIEDQTDDTKHPEPLADYLDVALDYAERQLGQRNVVPVYLKTGYVFGSDLAAEKVGYHVLDARALTQLLDHHPEAREQSDVFRDFARNLHNSLAQRHKLLAKLETPGGYTKLGTAFLQYEFLKRLRQACRTPSGATLPDDLRDPITRGNSTFNALPWVHWKFAEAAQPLPSGGKEVLLLRLEQKKRGILLSTRQYAKLRDDTDARAKRTRLRDLRLVFHGIHQEIGSPLVLAKPLADGRTSNESEVGTLFFNADCNSVPEVLDHFPRLHRAFLHRLQELGW